jgi:hypothetical protein
MIEAWQKIVAEMKREWLRWRGAGYPRSGWMASHPLNDHEALHRGARRGYRWEFADTSPPMA